MAACSACGAEFAVQLCPKCGGSAALTRRQINKTLVKYSYPAFAGLCGIVVADLFYPMLDRDPFLIAGVCLFLVPGLFHVVSSMRKRLTVDIDRIQRAYLSAGAVSVFLAILMACNGALDKFSHHSDAHDGHQHTSGAGTIWHELYGKGTVMASRKDDGRARSQRTNVSERFGEERHCCGDARWAFRFAQV
jgi:hypothetical protein